jgi:hypothetical protein
MNKNITTSLLVLMLICANACSSENEPFTAEMRFHVDSVSQIRIREAQVLTDSLCKERGLVQIPRLRDSIYQVRKAQMESKLREFRSGGQ